MSQPLAQAPAPTPASIRKRHSLSAEVPPPKRRQVTASSRSHSIVENWLDRIDVEKFEALAEEEATDTPLKHRLSIDDDKRIETYEDKTYEVRSPKRKRLNLSFTPLQKLTRETLKKLDQEDMAATAESSEQSSTKEPNMTPYNPDYILALQERSVSSADSKIQPGDFFELEQALIDLIATGVDLLNPIRERAGSKTDAIVVVLLKYFLFRNKCLMMAINILRTIYSETEASSSDKT